MNAAGVRYDRRFYRDADRAVLGGVCAGLADYLGFNLRTTRVLAVIAFFMVMPVAVLAYLAVVFLVPSMSRNDDADAFQSPARTGRRSRRRCHRKAQKCEPETKTSAPRASPRASQIIDKKCDALETRLAELEKRVTSKRFQLDQEFARL